MKKVIIVGATSGIGRELSKIYSRNGWAVGVAGRRDSLFPEIEKEMKGKVYFKRIDVTAPESALLLKELISEMGGVDVVVISSGTGSVNRELDWSKEKETIDVNVSGFALLAGTAFRYFCGNGGGCVAGISSIAAIRGGDDAPAYSASKAFVSNYLEGLRKMAIKNGFPVSIVDIQPGFVATNMAKGEGLFWVAPVEKAAQQIYEAIGSNRQHAYITRRWRLVAWLLKVMPNFIYDKI
ncbi:MAG TPA: oxidoreductase [Elusimicrobia bacterium]|nr:oxidoreductase [Elusimicrobiota bacterium]